MSPIRTEGHVKNSPAHVPRLNPLLAGEGPFAIQTKKIRTLKKSFRYFSAIRCLVFPHKL
jgi:hypothetical protein